MKQGPLDPRIDLMVAALYGELSAEEQARFDRLLAEDPSVRAEWDELRGTRELMAAWDLEETPPSFVLLEPPGASRRRETRSFGERIRDIFRDRTQLGWAVAVLATVLLVLAWTDFRVDLDGRGVAFRFGPPDPQHVAASPDDGSLWATDTTGTRIPLTSHFADASGSSPYVTREEFDAFSAGLSMAIGDLVQAADYNRTKNMEFNTYVRTLFQGLNDRQMENYYDLRGRIESVRFDIDPSLSGSSSPGGALEPETLSPSPDLPRGSGGR